MRPILNACSFLAGRLEEEAARPAMHQDPARCTARALSSSCKNLADHGQRNSTEADHATSLGGREGSLSPKQALNQLADRTSAPIRIDSFRVCGARIAWPSRLRCPTASRKFCSRVEAFYRHPHVAMCLTHLMWEAVLLQHVISAHACSCCHGDHFAASAPLQLRGGRSQHRHRHGMLQRGDPPMRLHSLRIYLPCSGRHLDGHVPIL